MTHVRARLALLALGAACAGAIAIPAQASAALSFYSCASPADNVYCDGRANGTYDGENSWDYNEAWNPGGGSYYVCERVYKPSAEVWLGNPLCGEDTIFHHYGNVTCVCYDAQIKQQSGSPNPVTGFADSAW